MSSGIDHKRLKAEEFSDTYEVQIKSTRVSSGHWYIKSSPHRVIILMLSCKWSGKSSAITRHNSESLCPIFCDLRKIITGMKWRIFSSHSWQWYEFCFIELMVDALNFLTFSPKSASSSIAGDVLFCALYLKIPQPCKMKLPCAGS